MKSILHLIFASTCLFFLVLEPAFGAPNFSAASGFIQFNKSCSPDPASKNTGGVCSGDRVGIKTTTTYFDIVKQVYPDLKPDGSSSASHPVRKNISTFSVAEDDLSGSPLSPGETLFFLRVSEGDSLKVLILQSQTGLLGYVQVEPQLKLLDIVGVAQDLNVSLNAENGLLPVRPGEFVFFANSWHFNSSENFNSYDLLLASPEKIQSVYDGPFLYGFRMPQRYECRVDQILKPLVPLAPGPAGYAGLRLRVVEQRSCEGKTQTTLGPERKFEAELKWDPAKGKYMGGSRELFRLNQCRMDGKAGCS